MKRLFSSKSITHTHLINSTFRIKPQLYVETQKGNVIEMNVPKDTIDIVQNFVINSCEPIGDNLKSEEYAFILVTQKQKDMLFKKKHVGLKILGGVLGAGSLITIGGFGSIMWLFSNIYH